MANPFFVQPAQYGQSLRQGAQAVDQFAQKQYMDEAKQAMASAFQSQDPMAIRNAVMQYPEIAETATQMFGFTNDQTEQVARETYRRALSETDTQRRAAIMEGGIETVRQFGGNPRMMSQDLRLLRENPEAFDRSAKAGFASIASDAEFEALFPSVSAGTVAPSNVREYEYFQSLSPEDQKKYINMKRASQTFRRGDVEMVADPTDPTTATVITETGQDPTSQAEEQEKLSKQQAKKQAEAKAAMQAITKSGEAYEALSTARRSIPKYDEAIRLIEEEGANTGRIASAFPSIQSSSVALDNIQRQLGLDVISSVTFGALSEKELEVAMQTALPTNMSERELVDWLNTKKRGQEKLSRYLEDAAIFLGQPGNTVADWMQKGKGSDSSSEQSIDSLINKYAD